MIKRPMDRIRAAHLFRSVRGQALGIRGQDRWERAFLHLLADMQESVPDRQGAWKVLEGFARSDIRILKKARGASDKEDPILICVILDEIERIGVFLEHYRKMGIKRFAFLDNGSADGTVERLKAQPDVDLFRTKDRFETKIKIGWIDRLMSYYGTRHWFLVVDADELLAWPGMEDGSIQGMIRELRSKNMSRARALMVDMYPRERSWDTMRSFDELFPECRYFDSDTYYHRRSNKVCLICGGPRKRMLGRDVWLTKYPLFRLAGDEIMIDPHVIYPYDASRSPCFLALLHYKFITHNDQEKMRSYAEQGTYACGSAEYRAYVEKQKEDRRNFQFYHEGSVEYSSSRSLTMIKEIKRM